MKKHRIRIIAVLLIIALFIFSLIRVMPDRKTEPDNPLLTKADVLKTDFNIQSGGSSGQSDQQALNGQSSDSAKKESETSGEDEKQPESEQTSAKETEKQPESGQTSAKETEKQPESGENTSSKPNESELSQPESETTGQDGQIKEDNGTSDDQDQTKGDDASKGDQDQTKDDDTSKGDQDQTKDDDVSKGDQGENGDNNPSNPGTDESGDIPGDNGGHNTDNPGSGDDPGTKEDGLVTDLYSKIITVSELTEDTLDFYAYYSDTSVDADIKVNYRHESDSGSGQWLASEDGRNYEAVLKLGKNYITIYYTDKNGERNWSRIVIAYQAEKADASKPEIGEHPPLIETNLDDWSGDINTSEFTFTVSAKTWQGKRIYSDSIQVMLDGKIVANPTGNGIYEYVLRFDRPKVGDYENHTVSVLAWDSEGNSRYVTYQFRYQFHNDGESLGTVHVVIDATTVECGIVDEGDVELEAGDTAATVVLKMLDEYGYGYESNGTSASEFYLASISRADAFRGCHVGDRLKGLLERDGVTFTTSGSRDKLGEFDFTRGSGWMYFINGSLCPGKAMSAWTLNGGETISLRFTLAYGKDVGGTSSSEGTLSSYCAQWVDGQVIELGHDYQETARVEPGPDTDGYIEYTCSKCGETKQERLPAAGGETGNPEQPGGGETENPEQPENGEDEYSEQAENAGSEEAELLEPAS